MITRATGTALHALLDDAPFNQALAASDIAKLRRLADDIEQDGTGGPLQAELHYRMQHDKDAATRDYCRRLHGSVRKYNDMI